MSVESGATYRHNSKIGDDHDSPVFGSYSTSQHIERSSAMREKVDQATMFSVLYFAISLSCAILTKAIMTKFFFDYSLVLLMVQAAITLFVLELMRVCSVIKLAPYTFDRGKDMFIPSVMYAVQGYFSLTALQGMNLPNYDPVKKLVPMLTMALSFYVLQRGKLTQQRVSKALILAVVLASIGSMLATAYDWTFDVWSAMFGIVGLVFQASYLVMIERYATNNTYTVTEMVYMNSFNCLIIFLMADLWQDEIRDAFMYFMTSSTSMFVFSFIAMCALSCGLQFTLFGCAAHASAVTTTIIHNFRCSLQTFLAYYMAVHLFFDSAPTVTHGIGLLICTCGTGLYGYLKMKEGSMVSQTSMRM